MNREAINNCPKTCPNQIKILSEFDRLTEENEELRRSRDGWQEQARLYCKNSDYHREQRGELQSILDRISEPIGKAAATSQTVRRWAKQCKQEGCHHIPEVLKGIADYLDSQKQEKPQCHMCMGKREDCPICNPKHLCNDGIWEYISKDECERCNLKPQLCPECKGAMQTWAGCFFLGDCIESKCLNCAYNQIVLCSYCNGEGVIVDENKTNDDT